MPPDLDLTPDEELAARIASRLAEAGFIDPARGKDVTAKIATGSATAEDWRLWIELELVGPTTGAADAED
jgi:hypothetical protein